MLVVQGDDRWHPHILGLGFFGSACISSGKSVGDTESGQVNLGKNFPVADWGNVAGCYGNTKGLQKDVTQQNCEKYQTRRREHAPIQ